METPQEILAPKVTEAFKTITILTISTQHSKRYLKETKMLIDLSFTLIIQSSARC